MQDYGPSILIALGANLPQGKAAPAETLEAALSMLQHVGLSVEAVSDFYVTPAFPVGSGPDFVNACAIIRPSMAKKSPAEVLIALHRVETALGRQRPKRWAPRVCDLDLLGVGAAVLPDRQTVARWMSLRAEAAAKTAPKDLVLPHPRLHERAFVLVPLADIAPAWRHPVTGRTVVEMRDALPAEDRAAVRPLTSQSCKSGRSGP